MGTVQSFFQNIAASISDMGALKVFIIAVVIVFIWQTNKLIGLVATILFVGYLAGWF
jgi:hypothetical protein